MKMTIYDVADKVGVSIATVSKVINDTGSMRDSTRLRVKDAMKELNYFPNVMASALMGKGTKTLGLLIPDISNPFFSEIAKEIEDRAHEKGFSVIMCSTDEDAEKEKKYIELLENQQVDGFIVSSTYKNKEILINLIKKGTPMVLLTQDDPLLDVTKVAVDDFKGGYEATMHLLKNGHRRIAVVGEWGYSSNKRIQGYLNALEAFNIELDEDYVVRRYASIANGAKSLSQIIVNTNIELPTAIFACNEQLAMGIIRAAKEKEIEIPNQLSLIGFDNTILATATALTTIAQPISDMGKRTVDVLTEEIKLGKSTKERILYNPELIIRETTSPIVVED